MIRTYFFVLIFMIIFPLSPLYLISLQYNIITKLVIMVTRIPSRIRNKLITYYISRPYIYYRWKTLNMEKTILYIKIFHPRALLIVRISLFRYVFQKGERSKFIYIMSMALNCILLQYPLVSIYVIVIKFCYLRKWFKYLVFIRLKSFHWIYFNVINYNIIWIYYNDILPVR